MKEQIPLKYACLDFFTDIVTKCKDDDIAKYLIELRDLITYQMKIIHDQRMEIVAIKHKDAWKHYDKPWDSYNSETRQYSNRPPKINNNESC